MKNVTKLGLFSAVVILFSACSEPKECAIL